MTGHEPSTTVGPLPDSRGSEPATPAVLTRAVWLLWLASVGALLVRALFGWRPAVPGPLRVDGLTLLMWVAATTLGGIVHSYARRYMAGTRGVSRFFRRMFAFVLVVGLVVAADHLALFAAAWLAMGLVMASLIGHVPEWPQATAAARLARRYYLAGSGLLAAGVLALWWATGATTVGGVAANAPALSGTAGLVAAGAVLLAAMVQSALVPFHGWLLSSMTAPTPASALMHAGFVNAGGILLVRFADVLLAHRWVLVVLVGVGGASALVGKLMKSVRADIKGQLGCSTVAQMSFMLLQAGLGFFGAAVTHLLLHGFYKAYLFLSSGTQVERTAPGEGADGRMGVVGLAVAALTAAAGGLLFVAVTGKGTGSGALLTFFVVMTALHASRELARRRALPAAVRFGAVPLLFLPAVAVYGAVYTGVTGLLADLPTVTAPTALTPVHVALGALFVLAYAAVEAGVHRRSTRLYVALLNASWPDPATLLTAPEEYDD